MSPSVTKRNKQVKHGSEFTLLCAFISMGYAQQKLTVLTIFYQFLRTSMVRRHKRRHPCVIDCWRSTVNKSITYRKGWRCGSNDCGISCQTVETTHTFMHKRTYEQSFLVTMSTSTNKHRYKNKLLGLLLPPPRRKTLREISNFIVKILLYLMCIVSLMTDT